MSHYIKNISAKGVHGRFDISQTFQPGINILFGKNGMGKTTMLHILANILNADFRRFAHLNFDCVEVNLDDGTSIYLERRSVQDDEAITLWMNKKKTLVGRVKEIKRQDASLNDPYNNDSINTYLEVDTSQPLLSTAYFPAFRTMIEAWASLEMEAEQNTPHWLRPAARRTDSQRVKTTLFARQLFEQFVPFINFPTPTEIEKSLTDEIQSALLSLAQLDREMLAQAFVQILEALSSKAPEQESSPDNIIAEIKALSVSLEKTPLSASSVEDSGIFILLPKLVHSLRIKSDINRIAVPILNVFRDLLRERVQRQEEGFESIKRYIDSVNEFLDDKQLEARTPVEVRGSYIRSNDSLIELEHKNGSTTTGLQVLSSGERQIITLIYAATHMSSQQVVLIDEPEISLHVDWQRMLLPKMSEQLGERQIIACTHSPIIGADYEDRVMELQLTSAKTV